MATQENKNSGKEKTDPKKANQKHQDKKSGTKSK